MLIVLFIIAMIEFIFLSTAVLVTLALFALERFIEWIDRISWNFMFQHEIKNWRKKNEKH